VACGQGATSNLIAQPVSACSLFAVREISAAMQQPAVLRRPQVAQRSDQSNCFRMGSRMTLSGFLTSVPLLMLNVSWSSEQVKGFSALHGGKEKFAFVNPPAGTPTTLPSYSVLMVVGALMGGAGAAGALAYGPAGSIPPVAALSGLVGGIRYTESTGCPTVPGELKAVDLGILAGPYSLK